MTATPGERPQNTDPQVRAAEIAADQEKRSSTKLFTAAVLGSSLSLVGTVCTAVFTYAGTVDDSQMTPVAQCPISPVDTAKALSEYDKLVKDGVITLEIGRELKKDAIADQLNDAPAKDC